MQNEVNLDRFHNRISFSPSATKKAWFIVLSTLAISFSFLATPLRAQFAYVTNGGGNNVSAYSIGSNGALTPVPGLTFSAGIEPISLTVTRPVLK